MLNCISLSFICLAFLNLNLEGQTSDVLSGGLLRSSSADTQDGHSQVERSPRSSISFLYIPEHSLFLCQWLRHLEQMRKSSVVLIRALHLLGGFPIVALHFPGVTPIVDGCFFGGRGR